MKFRNLKVQNLLLCRVTCKNWSKYNVTHTLLSLELALSLYLSFQKELFPFYFLILLLHVLFHHNRYNFVWISFNNFLSSFLPMSLSSFESAIIFPHSFSKCSSSFFSNTVLIPSSKFMQNFLVAYPYI